uniref:Uncharacterized protein n=1 Tax=Glossina brevipalpis TaxID=37001 RepID=A0A1A9W700_9MUSC
MRSSAPANNRLATRRPANTATGVSLGFPFTTSPTAKIFGTLPAPTHNVLPGGLDKLNRSSLVMPYSKAPAITALLLPLSLPLLAGAIIMVSCILLHFLLLLEVEILGDPTLYQYLLRKSVQILTLNLVAVEPIENNCIILKTARALKEQDLFELTKILFFPCMTFFFYS